MASSFPSSSTWPTPVAPAGSRGTLGSTSGRFPLLTAGTGGGGVLVLTADEALLAQLHRLAAAAGVELEVGPSEPAGWAWDAAALVLIGPDRIADGSIGMSRRPGVVLVAGERADAQLVLWQRGVEIGAEGVAVLPDDDGWLIERIASSQELSSGAAVLTVVGGCGGAGASVLSSAIAVVGALGGRRVLLVDADSCGGGLDLLLGADGVPGMRWPDLASARGRLGGGMLREALPRIDGLSVLAWDRADPVPLAEAAVAAVASAAVRGFDLVVVDLARAGLGPARPWLAATDLGLVVAPARLRSAPAAGRTIAALARQVADVRLVVRGPASVGVAAEDLADSLGVPLLGELRAEPGLDAALERGEAPGLRRRGPLARLSERILADLPARTGAA